MTRPTALRAADRPPAQVAPYVAVLGVDGAIEFLLAYGGAELYLPVNPKPDHPLAQMFGADRARALALASEHLPRRVPLQKKWIAAVWRERGLTVAEIARTLHVSDKTVREWLRGCKRPPPEDPQLSLPL